MFMQDLNTAATPGKDKGKKSKKAKDNASSANGEASPENHQNHTGDNNVAYVPKVCINASTWQVAQHGQKLEMTLCTLKALYISAINC